MKAAPLPEQQHLLDLPSPNLLNEPSKHASENKDLRKRREKERKRKRGRLERLRRSAPELDFSPSGLPDRGEFDFQVRAVLS
jgi:hypothetical protein